MFVKDGDYQEDRDNLSRVANNQSAMLSKTLEHKAQNLKGFLYGKQDNKCKEGHIHSKGCSREKDFDLAALQTTAFKYMVL